MTPDKSIEHTIECTLDEQQCQQECKHKTDRANCPLVKVYPRELFDGIIRISKQSTAPDKETPDWMFTDIRRGAKFGYKLGISKSIESEKAKDERIKSLEEELKKYSSNEICSECGQPDGKHRKRCSEYYRYMMDNDSDLGAQS